MAYLGLDPSEQSSGRPGSQSRITKAGNGDTRRMLIETAWSYRFPTRVSREVLPHQEGLLQPVCVTVSTAQLLLCCCYWRLTHAGKSVTVVTTAIAREFGGLCLDHRPAG